MSEALYVMSPAQYAKSRNFGVKAVRKMIARGEIPCGKIFGRYKIDVAAADKSLRELLNDNNAAQERGRRDDLKRGLKREMADLKSQISAVCAQNS